MRGSLTGLVALALLALVVAHGVQLRLKDPLSSPVLGAEDPYSHIVFTKESVDEGSFGYSTHLGTSMYPPGMHALLGILVPLSGIGWHEFARFVPIAFGALAIVAIYVLAARLAGRRETDEGGRSVFVPHYAAGLAAATVTAIMPEHVFRTNLLFPTALDLALLPAFLLAFVYAFEVSRAEDRVLPRNAHAWGVYALLLLFAIPLAFAHPWVVPLFLAPAAAYAALRVLREETTVGRATRALLPPAGLAVLGTAFAMAFRWDESDTGFSDFFSHLPGVGVLGSVDMPGPVLFTFLVVVLGCIACAAIVGMALLVSIRARLPRAVRVGVGVVVAAGLLALLALLVAGELPHQVHYPHMLGYAAIALALGGLVVACVLPTRLGDLALAVSIFLFPLTAINLFDSQFWPQRTVAYLCVGVALLAATLVVALHDGARRLATPRGETAPRRERALVGPALLVGAFLLVAGTAAALPASTYKWYRLYNAEHFEGFQEIVERLEEDPESRVITHGWQPALLVKALGDPNFVYYSPNSFKEADGEAKREKALKAIQGPAYLLVDKYLLREVEKGKMTIDFLEGQEPVYQTADGKLRLYCLEECP